jgi:hypothetical protein
MNMTGVSRHAAASLITALVAAAGGLPLDCQGARHLADVLEFGLGPDVD